MSRRLIDADALERAMYEEAFEKDTDMQRWDSGCWIRYKLYERVLDAQPTVDAVPVSEMLKVITELQKAEKERDYWMSKAHSYETTILRLAESITPKESKQ